MKTTQTLTQFFPAMRTQLTEMQLDVENNPPDWHKSLQAAIDQGAFLKIEFCLVAGGRIDARLVLVSQKGEVAEISSVADYRV